MICHCTISDFRDQSPTFRQPWVKVGQFWKFYIGRAVGGKLDLVVLIGGAEKLSTACPVEGFQNTPVLFLFTQKMAAASFFADRLANS
jgi:hypothetical protein